MSSNTLRDLRDERGRMLTELDEILRNARENGEKYLSVGEQARYDALDERVNSISNDIARSNSIGQAAAMQQISHAPGRDTRNFLPSRSEYNEIMHRAVSEGTDSAGGYFVPIQQADDYFDRLAAGSIVLQSRVKVLPMTGDELRVPKIGSSATSGVYAENAEITAADPTFEAVTLTPKKVATLTRASNESLADSNPALREVLAFDHSRSAALLIDDQMLEGSGSGSNMRGIRNFSGITVTALGAGNGATPALDDVASAIERLESDNAKATAILMHPRTWSTFRKLKDQDLRYQLQPDPTEEERRTLFGTPVFLSPQISIAETVGTSTDCSWIAIMQADQVVVGRREEVEVLFSEHRYFEFDQTGIRTTARFDISVINEEAVELLTGVRP